MSDQPNRLTPGDLSALMCARVCHDLISPIGALGTAIEVLDDPDNVDMHADALDLVKLSAKQAGAKLQFLRLAFGAGTSAPGTIPTAQIIDLANGMYGEGKVALDWQVQADGVEKSEARLVLNLIMISMYCIPRGGTLTIEIGETNGGVDLNLMAKGMKARLDPMVTRTLGGKAPEDGFDGRSIQPFYTGMMVRQLKAQLDTDVGEEHVRFSVSVPRQATQNAA